MEGSGESTLRAKYLDWCSARLAERFLDLSPEEIYALARPEAPDRAGIASAQGPPDAASPDAASPDAASPDAPGSDAVPPGASPAGSDTSPEPADSPPETEPGAGARASTSSSPSLPHPSDDDYRILVQRVTEALLKRTSLPTFEQWAEAYAESPERFDAELLGFWKDVVDEEPTEAEGD